MNSPLRKRGLLWLFAIAAVLAAVALWLKTPPIGMSFLTVWQEKDGQWWTTMLMTNQSTVDFGFEWLQPEDREVLAGNRRGPLSLASVPAAPIQIEAHSSMTHALQLPPPGMVRQFRIRYFPVRKPPSGLYLRIRRYLRLDNSRTPGRIAVSPEVIAEARSNDVPPSAHADQR